MRFAVRCVGIDAASGCLWVGLQVLWATQHYAVPNAVPNAPKTNVVYESSSFLKYKRVNEQFADAIVANYKEGDIGELKLLDNTSS